MPERTRGQRRPRRPTTGPGRFEATIRRGRGKQGIADLDAVPLDRVPDSRGRLRVLITADEIVTLLDLGYEVILHRHLPIQPMDPALIESDKAVKASLEQRFAAVRPAPAPARGAIKRSSTKRGR